MGTVFLKVLNMGLTAGFLILAVMVLRLFLKKAPRWIVCLLWALVAFKLVCPFSPESAFSLIPSREPLPEKIMTGNSFEVNTGIGIVDTPVNAYLEDHYYEGVTVPEDNGNRMMNLFGVVWAAGVVLMLLYSLVSYYRLYRATRVCICTEKNIYRCDRIDTPFILGIVRPRIYLPSGMDKEQAACVTAHEKAHLRRRDHLWKPAGFLLLSVYWFQPLCWVSYILLCRDIELACDEKVIRTLGREDRKAYAEALLSCSIRQSILAACPLAFGEAGVKERVKKVLYYKKPAFRIILAAIVCCIIAAVCFLTAPKEAGESTSHEEETAAYMEDVRMRAEWYAKTAYQTALEGPDNYDYKSWRVKYWEKCYTYDDLEGKVYEVYRFDYEFLSGSPEDVVLAGGMAVTEDGWVTPDYPDSRYLVYERDGEKRTFVTMLFENDCEPGDEVFTGDLLTAIREGAAAGKEQSEEADQDEENGIRMPADYRVDVIARMRKVGRERWRSLPSPSGDVADTSGILCIGEIPEKNIRVYGYNDEEIGHQGVAIEFRHVRSGGVLEADSEMYYYDWFYTSPRMLLPSLYWDEANERLQMSCHVYTGTGAAAEELHILQRYGTMQETNFSLEDYCALLRERIGWNFDQETRKLTLTDQKTGKILAEAAVPADAGESVTDLELGMISGFEPGDEIKFTVFPGYYMDEMYGAAWYEGMPQLQFELLMTQGESGHLAFALGNVKVREKVW